MLAGGLPEKTHWMKLSNKIPTVPIADPIVHPRDGDLIAATHGRSFHVMDISPLEEWTGEVLASDAHLFTVKPATAEDYRVFTNDEFLAEKRFIGENPAPGTTISCYLARINRNTGQLFGIVSGSSNFDENSRRAAQ